MPKRSVPPGSCSASKSYRMTFERQVVGCRQAGWSCPHNRHPLTGGGLRFWLRWLPGRSRPVGGETLQIANRDCLAVDLRRLQ